MGAAEIIELIRKEAFRTLKSEYSGFELGTVVSPYPRLAVKLDHMKVQLAASDLIICERLLPNTRIVSVRSTPGAARDLGDRTAADSNSFGGSAVELAYAELKFEETLKVGDRVLVQAVTGGQKYILVDRVVE